MIKKGTAFLLSIGAFLFGTVIGFLCAPVKKGSILQEEILSWRMKIKIPH